MSTIRICDVCSNPLTVEDPDTFQMVMPVWAWVLLGMDPVGTPIDICGVGCMHDLADNLDRADADQDPGDGTEDEDMNSAEDEPELPLIPQTRGGMPEGISLVTDYPTGVTMRS